MKRKRASRKCKPKKTPVGGGAEASIDPGYYSDRNEENDGFGSRAEIETRDVLARMSGRRLGFDEPVVNNETVGSAALLLARSISSSRRTRTSNKVPPQHERIGLKEPKSSHQNPVYNKKELDAAKSVIKKIMKMDAAVPFNAQVDPIALGIPDYFDVIETPMDFGTICSKLENGLMYRNSEEVFKDVQLIWDNCCKYNRKGSYILELMKRVKNNFMKQWNAAGLYEEQQTVSNGHLHHNLPLIAESTMRHEQEARHVHPVGPIMSRSAYVQQNDTQHQEVAHCCSHACQPQPISYHGPCSLHSGASQSCQHQHDLVRQYHCTQLQSGDLTNGMFCSQWVNDASPSLVRSCQPSPSLTGHPEQRGCMHHSTSRQLPPSRSQSTPRSPSTTANPDLGDELGSTTSASGITNLRNGRGPSRGLNLDKTVKRTGKMKIVFNSGERIPTQHEAEFAEAIGIVVRKNAELVGVSRWREIPETNKEVCRQQLLRWFEIEDWNTPRVQNLMDKEFQSSYRHWRSRLHDEYKKFVKKGLDPRQQSTRLEVTIQQWLSICDLFESPKFKDRSMVNSMNRKRVPFNHTSGKVRYLTRYRKMTKPNKIQLWKDTHLTKSGQFVNTEAELKYVKMSQLEAETMEEEEEPMSEDEILVSTLGHRSGCHKGMGGGVEVPRGANLLSSAQDPKLVKRLVKTQTELDVANQKIDTLTQDLEKQKEQNRSHEEKIEALQIQMQQMHTLWLKMQANHKHE